MTTTDALIAVVYVFVSIGVGGAIYFFPWIVAGIRHHRNEGAIAVLNIFLGWTGVGWVAALVWACTTDASDHRKSAEKGC